MINSNRKGKRGEREAAAKLREVLGIAARRGQQFHGGPDSPDLITDLWQVHFEVKFTERLNINKAMGQAIVDAGRVVDGKGRPALAAIPAVLHKKNRMSLLVTVRLEDLKYFARAIVDVLSTNKEPNYQIDAPFQNEVTNERNEIESENSGI